MNILFRTCHSWRDEDCPAEQMPETINEELIALFTTSAKQNEALCKSLAVQSDLIADLLKRLSESCGKQSFNANKDAVESAPETSVPNTKSNDACDRKLTREDWEKSEKGRAEKKNDDGGAGKDTGIPLKKTPTPDASRLLLEEQLDNARELIKFYREKAQGQTPA